VSAVVKLCDLVLAQYYNLSIIKFGFCVAT